MRPHFEFTMINFGELRKLSVQWHTDLGEVERAYATDWLLKKLFDEDTLQSALVLRGSAALRYAHFSDYPFLESPEFWSSRVIDAATLIALFDASAPPFFLTSFSGSAATVEYVGPLGRRSAAQARITLSFIAGQPRLVPVRVPLIHRFSDACPAIVAAVALDELAAERLAMLGAAPRVRDVFDLWFIVTRASIDLARARALAIEIAQSKKIALPNRESIFEPAHRVILERGWSNARYQPSFAQVEQDLLRGLRHSS